MSESKAIGQHLANFAQDAITFARVVDDDVGGDGVTPRSDRPDMQVVNRAHTGHGAHGFFDRRRVDVRGRPFEQDVDSVSHQAPRAVNDQNADGYAEYRISPDPTAPDDHHARRDRRDRPQQISEYVQKRAANIQVVVMRVRKL